MRIPKPNSSFLNLAKKERYFVSLWYSLTNEQSIDSYRVQLHNARTSIREISYHLSRPTTKPEYLKSLAEECLKTINHDPCLKDLLGFQFKLLQKRLRQAIPLLEDNKKAKDFSREPLQFLTQDITNSIELPYLENLKNSILSEIDAHSSDDFLNLAKLTTSLASDLIDRGWQLESLHSWSVNLLKNKQERPFKQRLEFMLRILTLEPQFFDVHLRLIGASKLIELEEFGGFSFSSEMPEVDLPSDRADHFLKAEPQIVYASSTVRAVDFKSATHQTLEKFEHCLDRVRFNFSQTKIFPTKEMLVIRQDDRKFSLEKISFEVPNPVYRFSAERFKGFNKRLDQLISNPAIDSQTVECLQAATRHYRLGQDAESYRDKFLSWWYGIEYLTQGGPGGIGERTARRAGHLLMQRYVFWLLDDLSRSTAREVDSIISKINPKNPSDVRCKGKLIAPLFLELLQNSSFASSLVNALEERPFLQARVKELSEIFSEPNKMREFLETHHQRVTWQLDRLWGIRCSLVHGSKLVVRLLVPVSNMEFYLRECLIIILRSLDQHSHITSLNNIFTRAELAWTTTLEELKDPSANIETIRDIAFDGLAYHPNNFHS